MKKIIALLLAGMLMIGATACDSASDESSKASSEASSDVSEGETAENPLDDGVLTIGVDDTYPPMEFIGDDGNSTGFDVEFAQALGEKLGVEVKFESTAWSGIFLALETSKYDCIISSVSITPDREEVYYFSEPYVANHVVLVTKPGSGIATPDDLAGKNVAVQVDTTAHDLVDSLIADGLEVADFTQYDSVTQALSELKLDRADGVMVDVVVAMYYMAEDPDAYEIVWESDEAEPIGICMRQDNEQFVTDINDALKALQEDGTMEALSEKWFSTDIVSTLD